MFHFQNKENCKIFNLSFKSSWRWWKIELSVNLIIFSIQIMSMQAALKDSLIIWWPQIWFWHSHFCHIDKRFKKKKKKSPLVSSWATSEDSTSTQANNFRCWGGVTVNARTQQLGPGGREGATFIPAEITLNRVRWRTQTQHAGKTQDNTGKQSWADSQYYPENKNCKGP